MVRLRIEMHMHAATEYIIDDASKRINGIYFDRRIRKSTSSSDDGGEMEESFEWWSVGVNVGVHGVRTRESAMLCHFNAEGGKKGQKASMMITRSASFTPSFPFYIFPSSSTSRRHKEMQ